MTSETQQRHCARSSVTNVLSLEQNSPQPTLLSILLEIHEIYFEENWRYRTLSKLETLFHVTNVYTVLNVTVASDRVSRQRDTLSEATVTLRTVASDRVSRCLGGR